MTAVKEGSSEALGHGKLDHRIDVEGSARRVRVVLNGAVIADTTRAFLLLESGHLPVYYFPREDVRMDRLHPTGHRTVCPYKGEASYWSVESGGSENARAAENVAWSYEHPKGRADPLARYIAFHWNNVDHWYEEDEEVFGHPRDPYHRVDVLFSSRPVKVMLGGETVAETRSARFLFETGMPTRYYIPREDVRTELLAPTETRSICPYKGVARYWSVSASGIRYEDVVWAYDDPIPECPKIKGLLCFYNERVDRIEVDGKPERDAEDRGVDRDSGADR